MKILYLEKKKQKQKKTTNVFVFAEFSPKY